LDTPSYEYLSDLHGYYIPKVPLTIETFTQKASDR